ncbi:MAG TPA: serine hydrolase domain-containing protein [Saprospiraceae bacterium]|nr:serine hydrolase domain-containing protein [Saprospiraceae bacterium]
MSIAMRGDYSSTQLLADLEKIPFRQDHRKRVSYSNYGYGLLGYIAEKVSGKSYPELLAFYLSEPYQLTQTTTRAPAADQLVTPYLSGRAV